jgi:Mg/Co/Ni transporter MgtE
MLMPIIAGMGGNCGDAGARGDGTPDRPLGRPELEQKSDAVSKELLVGLFNGFSLGALAAAVVWVITLIQPELPATRSRSW